MQGAYNKRHQYAAVRLDSQQVARHCGGRYASRRNMRIISIGVLLLLFSSVSFGSKSICPVIEPGSWDKMKESDFTKAKVQKQLKALELYFNSEIVVAEEFVYQSLLVIEGGALLQSVEYWKDDPKNHEHAVKQFCDFMKNKAYLVH